MNKYNEIDQDINRFLVGKSKMNPFNFIPFQVKVVKKPKVNNGLTQLRSLYQTAYSMKKHDPNYMNSIKTQRKPKTLPPSSLQKQIKQPAESRRKMDHSMLLQHLYSHQYLQTKNLKSNSSFDSAIKTKSKNKIQTRQRESALQNFINDDLFRTTVNRFKSFLRTQQNPKVGDILSSKRSFESRGYSTRKSFRLKRYQ